MQITSRNLTDGVKTVLQTAGKFENRKDIYKKWEILIRLFRILVLK